MSGAPATHLLGDRATRLFVMLAAFFCANAVLAEFIGVKIFALEDTLGLAPFEWNLFGQHHEQARGAVVQQVADARAHRAKGGGANGMVSGATAPPEMMKLMAWSTVQSVGVIFSTGTISR